MQFRILNKEEAHEYIDKNPNKKIMIITFDKKNGISDKGKFVNKRKCNKSIDKAVSIIESNINSFVRLELHDIPFTDLENYDEESIVKSIMLAVKQKHEILLE